MEFVSWDDDLPFPTEYWKSYKIPWFQNVPKHQPDILLIFPLLLVYSLLTTMNHQPGMSFHPYPTSNHLPLHLPFLPGGHRRGLQSPVAPGGWNSAPAWSSPPHGGASGWNACPGPSRVVVARTGKIYIVL